VMRVSPSEDKELGFIAKFRSLLERAAQKYREDSEDGDYACLNVSFMPASCKNWIDLSAPWGRVAKNLLSNLSELSDEDLVQASANLRSVSTVAALIGKFPPDKQLQITKDNDASPMFHDPAARTRGVIMKEANSASSKELCAEEERKTSIRFAPGLKDEPQAQSAKVDLESLLVGSYANEDLSAAPTATADNIPQAPVIGESTPESVQID